MNTTGKTLRSAVDKWLAPTAAAPARVMRCSRTAGAGRGCVRVEAMRPDGLLSFFFFRHGDGSWNVFPPAQKRPVFEGWRHA
ncbi:hypothetical protein QYH69_07460 [Paraburkholderia sp. SARCC-3016]|uniref:hypothetical protein n=1 Tax=Paraburkholderia sp. SARCC-3016 TaxID=3058611 RepID=UPI002808C8B3|nr:hypothetical protein [Paraburkholderia sp. SARCC-3016]MDQ7977082.1 hypothetical protein [Paraburkholderia sp. SARCC-3016]